MKSLIWIGALVVALVGLGLAPTTCSTVGSAASDLR
jgi:hypothetical protein